MGLTDTPELWPHQRAAIELAKSLPEYAFLFNPGYGKTRTLIDVLRHKVQLHNRYLKTLIVCPVIVVRNWKDEFRKFTKVDPKKIVLLEGSEKERIKTLTLNCFSMESPDKIVVTNFEGLLMKDLHAMLMKWMPEVVVADEMHKLKDPDASRSKLMRNLGARALYRYGLTGTSVLNSLMDVYGQWLFLDGGKTFGTNKFQFRSQYFYDKNAGMPKHIHFPKYIPHKDSAEKIKRSMMVKASVAEDASILNLPPLIKQTISVPMTKEQAGHYSSMYDEFMTWMKSVEAEGVKPVVAQTALTRSLRLMQLTSGFLKTEDGEEIEFKVNPKAKALEELLEQILPRKVVVWASFIRNYEMIKKVCTKLGANVVECHGGVSTARKFAAVEQFMKDDKTNVFVGHPASLGIGINLVAARYMIYYSRDYSLEHDIQSEARLYRAGSHIHESVIRYDLVTEGTVDADCVAALAMKQEVSFQVLRNWFR